MTRNLKALGLALVAAFAMSALFASGAQALKLTASSYPAILTGEQIASDDGKHLDHVFTSSGGVSVTCKIAKFAGTIKSADDNEEITITPTYEECSVTAGGKPFPATVKMTHCDYLFHGGVEVDAHTFKDGEADLVCPNAGESPHIEVWETEAKHKAAAATTCSLTPTPAPNLKGNTYTNTTPGSGKKDVDVTSNVTVPVVHRTGSILCGASTQTATYKGTTTLTAWEDVGVDQLADGPTTQTFYNYTEGAQLDLTVSK